MTRGAWIGIALGVLGTLVGIGASVPVLLKVLVPPPPQPPLLVRLDTQGPYLILATHSARQDFSAAIETAQVLHPDAELAEFDPAELSTARDALARVQPRYALVFIKPEELDVNVAWQWLTMTTELDQYAGQDSTGIGDPLVDVRTGFITGRTPAAALALLERTAAAVAGRVQPPGVFVDNLGPMEGAGAQAFAKFQGAMMAPVLGDRFNLLSVGHGKGQLTDERLACHSGAGLIHLGGHGHPDRIDDGLTAAQVPKLTLAPCVIFNGACYTGVTHRWYDVEGPAITERQVAPEDSFCLRLLETGALAYLAALHPDHGMPVYQEMEFLACQGGSLGDAIKHTYDGVVMGAGGKLPELTPLAEGTDRSGWTPADVMLKGTAARVLFGDPALILCDAFTPPPFAISAVSSDGGGLAMTATVANTQLKSTFTDTFWNDLNPQAPFNDRALVTVDLPAGFAQDVQVDQLSIISAGQPISHRLVGQAVEQDQGKLRLHVQVDVAAQGFQQSLLRATGATIQFRLRPGDDVN